MSSTLESLRATAEITHGDAACKQRILEILRELCLPLGIIRADDVEETGYEPTTGYFWIRQKKSKTHLFTAIKELVSYATEVTGYIEKYKIKKLTGVKVREFLIWITINEVYIGDPLSGKITFRTGAGLSETFPVSAFEQEW